MVLVLFWWIVIAISGLVGLIALLVLLGSSLSDAEGTKPRQQKAKRILIVSLVIFVIFGGVCWNTLSQPMNFH